MLICGQNDFISEELQNSIKKFFKKYNCAVIIDHMSNIDFENGINPTVGFDSKFITSKKMEEMLPELVISFGGQVFSGLKPELRKYYEQVKHWSIQPDGKVVDLFKSLDTIFECSEEKFFEKANEFTNSNNDMKYYKTISEYINSIK